MSWLRKLPGTVRATPGIERRLLRRLPWIGLAGTVVALAFPLAIRVFPPDAGADEAAKRVGMIDAIAIGALAIHWSAIATIAIGCVIVIVMKGPGYVADEYPLPDADRPRD
jgi:hypothetical protein